MAVLAPHLKRRKPSDPGPKATEADAAVADPTRSPPDLPAYLSSTTRDNRLTDISDLGLDLTDAAADVGVAEPQPEAGAVPEPAVATEEQDQQEEDLGAEEEEETEEDNEEEGEETDEEEEQPEEEEQEQEDDAAAGSEEAAESAGEEKEAGEAPAKEQEPAPQELPPIPPPPELGGIIARSIPVPPPMDRERTLDVLARTGMRPDSHHSKIRERLDRIAERARGLQDGIVRQARLAAEGALATFNTRADGVPGMIEGAAELVRGAYGHARRQVNRAAEDALTKLGTDKETSTEKTARTSLSMEQQIQKVLAVSSPAISALHKEQFDVVAKALDTAAGRFDKELGVHEKAIREAAAKSPGEGTPPTSGQTGRLKLPPLPWSELAPAREEAERQCWQTRAGQKADDVLLSIKRNQQQVLSQKEPFSVLILQLVNPAVIQETEVARHQQGQVGAAKTETVRRIASDHERAVNTVKQYRDRALHKLDAGEKGALKEIEKVGRRLEIDVRTRGQNLELGIMATARDLAESYRVQMAALNDSMEMEGFVEVAQVEPLLAGGERRFEDMYAEQSAGLGTTAAAAIAETEASIESQTRSVGELANNSAAEARKIAREHTAAIGQAASAYTQSFVAPAAGSTVKSGGYTATTSEALGKRPAEVRTAVASMIARTAKIVDDTVKSEDLRLKGEVTNLWPSLRDSVVADGLKKISELNANVQTAYKAMAKIGTDEEALLGALHNLTIPQVNAMRAIWLDRIPVPESVPDIEFPTTLDEWLDDELSGDELSAAEAYMRGDTAEGARYEIEASMRWYGDDESRIEHVLRDLHKEPPPGGHIKALQQQKGWEETHQRLKSNLGGTDLDVSEALLAGNRFRADALRLRERIEEARRKGDSDKVNKLLEAVPAEELAAVRREFLAAKKNWGPGVKVEVSGADAQKLDEEARKEFVTFVTDARDQLVPTGSTFGPAFEVRSMRMRPGDEQLAVALASRTIDPQTGREAISSQVDVRAARMEAEVTRRGDPNLEKLEKGFQHDEGAELSEDLHSLNKDKQKDAERRRDEAREVRMQAMRKFAVSHGKLANATDEQVKQYTAGVVGGLFDSEEGKKYGSSMVESGFADPAAAMRLAVEGRGTDEDLIKRTLGRLDRDQIEKMKEDYRSTYHEDLDERLGTNQPKRDERLAVAAFTVSPLLGVAMLAAPGGELSGDDRLEVNLLMLGRPRNDRERYELELARVEQQRTETGFAGKALMAGSTDEKMMDANNKRLIAMANEVDGVPKAFDEHGRFIGSNPTTDDHGVKHPSQEEAWAFGEELKWNQFGAESYQAGIDQLANLISTALAVLAAVVVAIVIPGAGGAIAGAIIGGLLGMASKAALKGGRYGWEEAAVDLAVTAVDAITAGLTHGMGQALRGAGTAAKIAAKPAGMLAKLGSYGGRAVKYVATEGLENFVGAIPSAFTGQVLNDQNWKGGSPFTNILEHTFMEAGISTGIGLGVGVGMEAVSGIGAIRGQLRERAMRAELLSSIPSEARHAFANTPVFELPPSQFDAMTGSRTGQAVTIFTPDGPVIYMREGASPHVLREEGIHLMQSREAEWSRQIADLSESNLARWHELPLEQQLALYRTKLDVEIDAQKRLLLDLGDELALAGPLSQSGLRKRMREAETTLGNLERRRIDVDRFPPERVQRIADRLETRPQYLDDPPRLFAKKTAPAGPRKSSKKSEDPFAREPDARIELPTEAGHADYSPLSGRSDITGTVVEVGPRWVEANGREYRMVAVADEAGRLSHHRQEIRSAHEDQRWVQRGSESIKQGELAEQGSRRLSAADSAPLGWSRSKAIESQWDASGRGFDEVVFDFRMDGNDLVARVRVIEVKDYPGRYVPLDSFTAIRPGRDGNLNGNLKDLGERLRTKGTATPPDGFGLKPEEARAARAALALRQIELEIRITPETHIGERDIGTVIQDLEAEWKKFGITLTDPVIAGRRPRVVPEEHIRAAKEESAGIGELDTGPGAATDSVRMRKLRHELLRSARPDVRGELANVPIREFPAREFRQRTGSESGQAVTVITATGPQIWVKQGAPATALREEGIHVQQFRERGWRDRVNALSESNLANWHTMPLADQLSLYRTKLEVEIEAQHRLLSDLATELGVASAATRKSVRKQMTDAQEALGNLSRRLDEVDAITRKQMAAMSKGKEARPSYLDQPPRLFSKRSTTGSASVEAPARPGEKLDRLLKKKRLLKEQIEASRQREAAATRDLGERAERVKLGREEMELEAVDLAAEIDAELERVLPELAEAVDPNLSVLIDAIRTSEKGGRRLDAQQVVDSLRNRTRKLKGSRRGVPPQFGHLEGSVSLEALEQNVIAIEELRRTIVAVQPDAVLAVQRGGAFLADVLSHGQATFPPVHTVEKHVEIGPKGERIERRIPNLEEAINNRIIEGQSRFVIVDVYMGGVFAKELEEMMSRIIARRPDVTFDVLWLRETAGFEDVINIPLGPENRQARIDALRAALTLGAAFEGAVVRPRPAEPGRLVLRPDAVVVPKAAGNSENIAKITITDQPVTIALGDDMTQTVFNPSSREPVRIFDRHGRVVQVIRVPAIDPDTGERLTTVRDVVIRLMQGAKFPKG